MDRQKNRENLFYQSFDSKTGTMEISCKISHSVILFVERQGTELDVFFENFETPMEVLKDPSCWISLQKMEDFLSKMKNFLKLQKAESHFRKIGQNNFELQAWGVLDSVLKMLESPEEIFSQPDRFLSYFLSPHPLLETEIQEKNKVRFRLKHKLETPLVLSYLLGTLEGLPNYMGMEPVKISQMDEACFEILWSDRQQKQSLFDEQEEKRHQFHPEIVKSVIQNLQEGGGQSSLATRDQRLIHRAFEKMVAIEVKKKMALWIEKQKDFDQSLFKIKDDFYKMYDYFTRAQQIITLISPSARKASVREAMRRVDWDHVQKHFPEMVESACNSILSVQKSFHQKENS